MSQAFATPQQAEDAFYDALEERDDALMLRVWDDSPDIALLLPMQPLLQGSQVHEILRDLLHSDVPLDIQVRHLHWVEFGDVAIHYVEERNNAAGPPGAAPPLFATNVFRRRDDAWVMILHQNAPPPPPEGGPPR
ncbi:MAG: nuclear transport factor 2 family protein [Thiohalocapsa sp.]